jgi:1-deoxy-D-xylulose-5-phosphate synthase
MQPGKAEILVDVAPEKRATAAVAWVYGALVNQALEFVERMQRRGVEIALVDARFVKPLDEDLLGQHLASFKTVITLEEHQRAGGFGSAVLEVASRTPNVRAQVKVLGIPDRFVDHMTTREEQLAAAGIDADALERALRSALQSAVL